MVEPSFDKDLCQLIHTKYHGLKVVFEGQQAHMDVVSTREIHKRNHDLPLEICYNYRAGVFITTIIKLSPHRIQ